jgi:hypothetical protein
MPAKSISFQQKAYFLGHTVLNLKYNRKDFTFSISLHIPVKSIDTGNFPIGLSALLIAFMEISIFFIVAVWLSIFELRSELRVFQVPFGSHFVA